MQSFDRLRMKVLVDEDGLEDQDAIAPSYRIAFARKAGFVKLGTYRKELEYRITSRFWEENQVMKK